MATVESDQNLLFGILALQNGLIEQPDLIAAFQCWSQGTVAADGPDPGRARVP